MASPEREHWQRAINEELVSLKENETYKYVRRPRGRKTVRTKWVFKIKTDRDGKIRYKACLVILGYEQVWGIDYDDTYAAVVRFETLRTILLYATIRGWTPRQYDFVTAFLNAKLTKFDIFADLLEGLKGRTQRIKQVWLLLKSLYGLHQAPLEWNNMFHAFMINQGF